MCGVTLIHTYVLWRLNGLSQRLYCVFYGPWHGLCNFIHRMTPWILQVNILSAENSTWTGHHWQETAIATTIFSSPWTQLLSTVPCSGYWGCEIAAANSWGWGHEHTESGGQHASRMNQSCSLNVKCLPVLFWKAVETLGGRVSLEGVGHWGWALTPKFTALLSICSWLLEHRCHVISCLILSPTPCHDRLDPLWL